jgi:dinuclear metal center YbgI/SA1388 family protein
MNKQDLISYLNEYLNILGFDDSSKNWLQIDNEKDEIKKIGYAVDASTYIFDKAIEEKVDMLLVHHWMFWWNEQVLVWIPFERVKRLIKNDIALYGVHLPLDAHNEVWNNIWLLNAFVKVFDFKEEDYQVEKFAEYHWEMIWFWLRFKENIDILDVIKYAKELDLQEILYNFWNKDFINSIAFCSWSALDEATQAKNWNYDLLVTWEWWHWNIILAKELWQSVLLWWHYETEKIWPKLLAEHLKEMFGIEIVYLDEKY